MPNLDLELALAPFAAWLRSKDYSSRSVEQYVSGLRRLHAILSTIHGEPPDLYALIPHDVSSARDHLLSKGKSAAAANWVVHAAKAWALSLDRGDLLAAVKTVRVGWQPRESLTRVEYNRLLRVAEAEAATAGRTSGLRNRALLALLLGCGLRPHEAPRVLLSDVTVRAKSGWLRVRGKGLKERQVPIPQQFRHMLDERVAEVLANLPPAAEVGEQALLGTLGSSGIQKIVARWGKAIGMPRLHPYVLRRTRGQLWRQEGQPIEQVAGWLGHESIDTTKIYTTPLPGEMSMAAATEAF